MKQNDTVIICGLGHVGFRVFELLDSLGMVLTVISDRALTERINRVTA